MTNNDLTFYVYFYLVGSAWILTDNKESIWIWNGVLFNMLLAFSMLLGFWI